MSSFYTLERNYPLTRGGLHGNGGRVLLLQQRDLGSRYSGGLWIDDFDFELSSGYSHYKSSN